MLAGLHQGRFTAKDPVAAFITTAVADVLTNQMLGANPAPLNAIATSIGTVTGNLEQRISTAVLLALGIGHEEAEAVSAKVAGMG